MPSRFPPLQGTITQLDQQVRHRDRVNVYLDGRFAFGLSASVAAAEGLQPGRVLTADDVARLLHADAVHVARDAAVRYLGYRPRSEAEVRAYLERRKGVPPEIVDAALDWLRRHGYVDDTAFAQFWVSNRMAFRPRGARALRAELREKGVARETIDTVLKALAPEEDTLIEQVARAYLQRLTPGELADAQRFRTRLGSFLARRGFTYEAITAVVRRLWNERTADHAADPSPEDAPR
jgi:regulatory protein